MVNKLTVAVEVNVSTLGLKVRPLPVRVTLKGLEGASTMYAVTGDEGIPTTNPGSVAGNIICPWGVIYNQSK